MSIRERFKKIRKIEGKTQAEFAVSLNTNQQSIADIENGRKALQVDIMENLHNKYNYNLNWLVCGSGKMKEYSMEGQVNEPESDYKKNDIPLMQRIIDAQDKTIKAFEDRMKDLTKQVDDLKNQS